MLSIASSRYGRPPLLRRYCNLEEYSTMVLLSNMLRKLVSASYRFVGEYATVIDPKLPIGIESSPETLRLMILLFFPAK
jgi:hypothetical protein